jgi:glyoxylase I family protein
MHLGLNHIGLSVANLERSIAFYCDLLGFEVVFPILDALNFDGRRAVLSVGSQILDLNEFAGNRGETFDPVRTGLDHVSFTIESREELDGWGRWLDEQGIERSPIRDHDIDVPPVHWQVTMFDFLDPDRIQLEFVYVPRMELGTVIF